MYDYILIGAGVSSVFALLRLQNTAKRILVLEAGPDFNQRDPQDLYQGFGGLGLAEGKYNFAPDFGGALAAKIGVGPTQALLAKVAQTLDTFGGQHALRYVAARPAQLRHQRDLVSVACTTQHLGTHLSRTVFGNMYQALKASQIEFRFQQKVQQITPLAQGFAVRTALGDTYRGQQVILATGVAVDPVLAANLRTLSIFSTQTRVDVGCRIETQGTALDVLLGTDPEVKLRWGERYTYCMNKHGRVVLKRQHNWAMADGQNYRENGATSNLNFTLFQPHYFASSSAAQAYLTALFQDRSTVIGQRLGDVAPQFAKGQLLSPTLAYQKGPALDADLLKPAIQFLDLLQQVTKTPIDGQTMLYGYDAKFYPTQVKTNAQFETGIPGLYCIGDCSGATYSLAQAAASGVYLGQIIAK
ncbi:hypothetical protein [Agrilactobacillus composti]|nr:hypothetical protein [Agrilactobacillus composti]